jgi:hypothetical protein
MGWLKRVSIGIKIVFGRKIEVRPTVGIGIDNSDINKLLKEAQGLVNENRISGDRKSTENDHDQGRKD